MATTKRNRRRAPKRAFIGPLAMLAVGAVASVLLWRTLMLDPPAGVRGAGEHLSPADRQTLEQLLRGTPASR
jgi:uncharacterized membrane protein